jgi:xanthine dehydrogenase accessory factor
MLIVGAVHIAQPLARMAALTGYLVTIIDPRAAFASTERFPDVAINSEWPDDAMKQMKPDRRTAVVTVTHDPKLDDPGLAEALRSEAFYIGALGSRKTHAKRAERLRELGFTDEQLARIKGPVGLKIGAISPAEIAVSIMAEVTQVLRAPVEQAKAERAAQKAREAAE